MYRSNQLHPNDILALKSTFEKPHTDLERDLIKADIAWCLEMGQTIKKVRDGIRKACPHPVEDIEYHTTYHLDTYGSNGYSKRYLTCNLCHRDLYQDSME